MANALVYVTNSALVNGATLSSLADGAVTISGCDRNPSTSEGCTSRRYTGRRDVRALRNRGTRFGTGPPGQRPLQEM